MRYNDYKVANKCTNLIIAMTASITIIIINKNYTLYRAVRISNSSRSLVWCVWRPSQPAHIVTSSRTAQAGLPLQSPNRVVAKQCTVHLQR